MVMYQKLAEQNQCKGPFRLSFRGITVCPFLAMYDVAKKLSVYEP